MFYILLAIVGVSAFIAFTLIVFEASDIDIFPDRHFESKYPILKFDTFLSLYALKPDSWALRDDHVVKYGEIKDVPERGFHLYRHVRRSEEFGFSKKDMKKYVKWLRNKREKEKTAKKR